jgi:multisubunit Na+/H+ antiporter MnhB subunit
MKNEIVKKFAVAGVLSLLGIILITSTMLTYSTNLTSEITEYCLDNLSLTGAINVVCAILLDFRAYDTLGEVLIIFVTISGVMLLTGRKK